MIAADTTEHFRDNTSISSAEGGDVPTPTQPSSLAVRLTFDKDILSAELLAALAEDQQSALSTAGQQLYDEIGKDSVWRIPSEDALQFIEDRANLLANVPDEVHAEIMQSIEQGLQAGESRNELMARISAAFDEIGHSRAETIANTETAAAFNYARDKAMHEAGVTHKRWLHSQSPLIKEPRPTHVDADGQTVPIDEPFDVGGVQFMRPADDSLGAGPEDIINCHCVAIPVEAPIESGDKPGHEFHGNQYVRYVKGSGVSEDHHNRVKRAVEEMPTAALQAAKNPIIVSTKSPLGKSGKALGSYDSDGNIVKIHESAGANTRNVVIHEVTHSIMSNNHDQFVSAGRMFDEDIKNVKPSDSILLKHYMESPREAVAQSGALLLGERVRNASEFKRAFPKTIEETRRAFAQLGIQK